MRFELKTPLKDQAGKTHQALILKPTMKVKDVKLARELSTKDGKQDSEEFLYHLAATMSGLAYEDILELDIQDGDRLDGVLAEIRYPSLKEPERANGAEADPKDSTPPSSSSKHSKL